MPEEGPVARLIFGVTLPRPAAEYVLAEATRRNLPCDPIIADLVQLGMTAGHRKERPTHIRTKRKTAKGDK